MCLFRYIAPVARLHISLGFRVASHYSRHVQELKVEKKAEEKENQEMLKRYYALGKAPDTFGHL